MLNLDVDLLKAGRKVQVVHSMAGYMLRMTDTLVQDLTCQRAATLVVPRAVDSMHG